MLGKTTNQLLQKTEQAIEAKVPANLKAAFERTVTAGLTIMYSASSNKHMQEQLSKPGDPLQNVGEGAAKLVGILYRQSNHTMPVSIAAPVAIVFMCEALDFLEQSGKVQVNADTIEQATQDTAAFMLQLLDVSQDKLHQVLAKGQSQDAPEPEPTAAPAPRAGIIGAAMGAQ